MCADELRQTIDGFLSQVAASRAWLGAHCMALDQSETITTAAFSQRLRPEWVPTGLSTTSALGKRLNGLGRPEWAHTG